MKLMPNQRKPLTSEKKVYKSKEKVMTLTPEKRLIKAKRKW